MNSHSDQRSFSSVFVIVAFSALISIVVVQAELAQVNVLFRHGDRAPDDSADERYPNDPYLNYSFYPIGRGQLSNIGKRREYALGQFLRERYVNFLGDTYTSRTVSALSSDYDRTKMSLQLVLAGLFPPNKLQQWNPYLNWQPIPAKYLRRYEDNIFLPEDCMLFVDEYNRVLESAEGQKELSKYSDLMEELTLWTGKNISTPWDFYYMYHTLAAEESLGLTLPEWSKDIFPRGELWDATVFSYNIANGSPLLKRLYGGPLLRMIKMHFLDTIIGVEQRKMHLFSGHESNIAAVLSALGVYYPHVPQYSSAVILELHSINNAYYVKVLNYLGIPSEIIELQLPNCEVLCPFDEYLKSIEDVIPSNEELICDKGTSLEYANRKSTEESDLLKYNLIRTSTILKPT